MKILKVEYEKDMTVRLSVDEAVLILNALVCLKKSGDYKDCESLESLKSELQIVRNIANYGHY